MACGRRPASADAAEPRRPEFPPYDDPADDAGTLRHHHHILQTICDSIPDAVYVKDRQGRYMLINTACARFLKKSVDAVVGRDDTALFDPDAARAIMETDRRVMETGRSETGEDVVTIGNATRTFLSTKLPYRDDQGRIVGIIGISRDITARKQMDEQLRQANRRLVQSLQEAQSAGKKFRGLLEAAPDAIVGVDREGRIALVNTQAEAMFGYDRNELIGQPVEVLMPEHVRRTHIRHRGEYVAAPRTRPMGTGLDLAGRRKDGTEFPVEISLSPMETDEGMLITSIIRDVTDRKQLENQLRQYAFELERLVDERTEQLRAERDFSDQVIQKANSLVIVLSQEGRIRLFNQRCEETTGFKSEEVLDSDWTRFLPEDAREQGRLMLSGVIEKRMPDIWECPLLTKDGTRRTVIWRLGVIQEDAAPSVIVIGLDVTEQRRLQEQVLQSERMAAVGRMAAQVAHEIRNPLSSIGLNIELLADEIRDHTWEDSEESEDLIRIVLSEIERLNHVIHDYLMFARMPVKQPQPESINSVVADLMKLVQTEAERAGVKLTRRLTKRLPPVEIDRALLGQALLNCVRNSIEAMPDGGTLKLFTRLKDGHVELSIQDTGHGIPPEHQSKVFDPFYSTKDKGTGLGLPYVRQIMQEHGGHIVLKSQPDVGTAVTLRFPVNASWPDEEI